MLTAGGAVAVGAVVVLYPNAAQVAGSIAQMNSSLTHHSGDLVMTRPVILFACIHNGGRSLAAKVLAGYYGGDAVEVRSAGSEPGDSLNPAVVEALHERGLSCEGESPGLLTVEGVRGADIVITMGCGETCPVFHGKRYEDWELDDPRGQDIDTVRRIVGDVDERVRALLSGLGVETAS